MMNTIHYAEDVYYKDRAAWDKMVERAMNADYSWDVSAKKYEEMYNELIDQK
jgi:starch synthase